MGPPGGMTPLAGAPLKLDGLFEYLLPLGRLKSDANNALELAAGALGAKAAAPEIDRMAKMVLLNFIVLQ